MKFAISLLLLSILCVSYAKFLPYADQEDLQMKSDEKKAAQQLNNRVMVGVLTNPLSEYPYYSSVISTTPNATSYIEVFYNLFLQAAGARVVPLKFDYTSESDILSLLPSLNGVVFVGGPYTQLVQSGSQAFTKYTNAAQLIFNYALSANRNGTYYPVFGLNQGLEVIDLLLIGNTSLATKSTTYNKATNLKFTKDPKSSQIFKDFSDESINALKQGFVSYDYAKYGMYYGAFKSNKILDNFFTVVAQDARDESVCVVEGKTYPVYGIHLAPEKTQFDFSPQLNIPHNYDGIQVAEGFSDFIVNECRQNLNSFGLNYTGESAYIVNNFPTAFKMVNNSYQASIYTIWP